MNTEFELCGEAIERIGREIKYTSQEDEIHREYIKGLAMACQMMADVITEYEPEQKEGDE